MTKFKVMESEMGNSVTELELQAVFTHMSSINQRAIFLLTLHNKLEDMSYDPECIDSIQLSDDMIILNIRQYLDSYLLSSIKFDKNLFISERKFEEYVRDTTGEINRKQEEQERKQAELSEKRRKRKDEKKIKKAMKILEKHGFTVSESNKIEEAAE